MHVSAVPGSNADASSVERVAFTVPDAAKAMSLGERTVWELVRTGELESVKVGRARRVTRATVLAFLERKRAEDAA